MKRVAWGSGASSQGWPASTPLSFIYCILHPDTQQPPNSLSHAAACRDFYILTKSELAQICVLIFLIFVLSYSSVATNTCGSHVSTDISNSCKYLFLKKTWINLFPPTLSQIQQHTETSTFSLYQYSQTYATPPSITFSDNSTCSILDFFSFSL